MIEEFKIYIVNLKKDKNRRENIIREVEKQNLTNYEIIDAVDGNKLNQNELDVATFRNKKHVNRRFHEHQSKEFFFFFSKYC